MKYEKAFSPRICLEMKLAGKNRSLDFRQILHGSDYLLQLSILFHCLLFVNLHDFGHLIQTKNSTNSETRLSLARTIVSLNRDV